MIFRLFLLLILFTNICSAQKYLHIYGKIEPRSSDTVSLYAYKTTFSFLNAKELIKEVALDANGNYAMKIPWNEGLEINLQNGQNWIVYNIFLNPCDSLEISQVGIQFLTNGKGSENVEYAFTFRDKFYNDSNIRTEYKNSFGSKNTEQFDAYIFNRKNAQLQFLDDFNKKQKLSSEAYEVQKANIIYHYAVDKLQYLWKHTYANKVEGNIIVDNSYFSFIKDTRIDKAYAEKASQYYSFLNSYVDAIWMNHLYTLEVTKRKNENPYLFKKKVADSLFTGREKEIVLALIILNKIRFPSNLAVDNTDELMFADFEKVVSDKELYNRLLVEYHAVNSLIGKPAPAFTAITKDGKIFNLGDLKGKIVLLDIWSTTCGPCIKAIPESIKLAKELDDKPFVALNLCMNSTEENWKKVVAKHKWNGIQIYSKNDTEIFSNYHFNSFPQYILIDKNGNIVNLNSRRPGNKDLKIEILKLL